MGLVWDIDKEADEWVKQWRKYPRRAVRAVWAPEIHYLKNNYFICFSVMEGIVKEAPQSEAFREEWLARCREIIDKYQPDILWFDNGINSRSLDPVKLRLAAYYYNRAAQWQKEVSLSTKGAAYLYGTITDYERQGRAPKEITKHSADDW